MFPDAELLARADELDRSGHPKQADRLLSDQFREVPRRHAADAGMAVAIHFHEAGRFEHAQRWFKKAVAARSREESGIAAFRLGALYLQQGRRRRAAKAFGHALAYRGIEPSMAALLRHDLLCARDPDEARAALRFAASCGIEPIAGPARLRLALALLIEGNAWGAETVARLTVDGGHSACVSAARHVLDFVAAGGGDLAELEDAIDPALSVDLDALYEE